MPGITITCDGIKYAILVETEERHLCYCEWLFEIATGKFKYRKTNINLTSISHDSIYITHH